MDVADAAALRERGDRNHLIVRTDAERVDRLGEA
jgi:hypothetical protein